MALALTLPTCFWGNLLNPLDGRYLASVLTSAAITLPVMLRRVRPLLMLAIVAVAAVVQCAVLSGPTASLLAVPIVAYSVARWVDGRSSRLVLIAGIFGSLLGPLRWVVNDQFAGEYISRMSLYIMLFTMCYASVIVPYLVGRRLRENDLVMQERAQAALERYEAELAAREERALATEARVRNDIARELHDVVAHSLSVIIVQAEGGKALAQKNPQAAGDVLDTIAETGREALTEMRRIVGVLREGPSEAEYAPQPGLGDIASMVDRAGERVHLVINGPEPAVPQTVGLNVYRIVQEAVTNFFKHAGPQAHCTVRVDYLPTQILLDITDDGLGSAASNDGAGNGLRGMRERAAAMGGRVNAQPRPGGGFRVRARLPLSSTETGTQASSRSDSATRSASPVQSGSASRSGNTAHPDSSSSTTPATDHRCAIPHNPDQGADHD